MLRFDNLTSTEIIKVRKACSLVFSLKSANRPEFIEELTLSKVKQSYRSKTKRYHPDKNLNESKDVARARIEQFIKIQEAYQYLTSFANRSDSKQKLERRDPFQERRTPEKERRKRAKREAPQAKQPTSGKTSTHATIIAIGGAKGGIGKTIFAANMAVYLASQKKKTIAVDLDLGGANLHLYLGETFLKHNLNDYFDKSIPSLEGIISQTKFGTELIGGESSRLGAANIHFSHKLKLMRGLRQLNADYVILDLGGDVNHNIIDFFLMADHQFVISSSEPASYLDAYSFLKVAIYRKLSRVFGVESPYYNKKNPELEKLIETALSPSGEINDFHMLIELVKNTQPHNLEIIQKVISSFSPYLLVNRVSYEPDVSDFISRIQSVLWKTTATKINYLGNLPRTDDVEISSRELVPIISKRPSSPFSKKLKQIANQLFC